MNDKYSTTEGKTSEKLSDEAMLSAQWKNIDWHKAEREVNRLQIRIVKATQQKDYNAVKRLQYLLTHSFYAKALAVKRVVTNDGRRTPGVDGVLWNTPAKKMAAVLSLTDKGYRARPLRRVYIEKKDKKKKRPLGIPTMYDRAMQALYALALEPVVETTADGKSFGFRKGRCAQDACEYLFNALSRKHISPKWVLEGDIKGCFDHISHDWLLANIPMDKNILKQFLKAGFIYQRELFPTEEGTPQGGIISPILANMTLDGIEKKLVEAGWQMADEYLSGDVRAKLRMAQFAAETNPEFVVNVDALTKAQPRELEASEIDVRLGATWLDPDIIQKFMTETFQIPYYLRHAVKVRYSPYTAEWRVEGKTATGRGDIISSETYGTSRANAYKILEETLNLKDVRIYDTIEDAEGKPKRVLNKRETMLAQQKQQVIKDAFANWVWQDPQRRIALVRQYNELFNSTRPREYDGSHIKFVGMNPEITLREHQRNAIAHVLYGGNTLLAHEVGAGKTYEMAASAMEAKRLGLCQKSLFVVPNHLTEQWASEFLNLYPNAKLLVARRKDFETANRKKFCARIATGDYDAVIIGHSQFERIPLSFERQERIIQEQIYETLAAINELKVHAGENFSIKQMEKTRKTLETKLEKLRSDERKDDVITFEQLGVDRLFVDESHFYKNLFLTTKMRNVAGLSTSEAQKSSDMFGKCRYLDEITGGRGVVFATGTPVSNSMTELYTVMRYLQYSTLQQKKLTHFDCWASTFGETTTAIELAPEGTGYRARTRFAKFFNLPELMSMFKEVADIKTSDQLHLPVPEAKFETVVAKPSDIQKEMVQELSKRAADIHSGIVDASVDNMLCVTNDGRKIGLDVRLMNPMLPDDPNSKLNVCVQNVLKIWEDGKDQKLTQLLFCDLSTPKNDGNFNVYDDIREKLVAAGVPENEIEFIHNADTEAKKAALFSKVRSGDVRVLLGSTAKMGAGTNVQSRLVAVHHLDVGWKPSDMTQRNGRIIRQGNMNKEVKVFNYVTEGTFDSYLYVRHEVA